MKGDLEQRLEAYFATLRASGYQAALKRGISNWKLYAAVSGSAMAMATGASAALIGSGVRNTAANRAASVRPAKQFAASSNSPPYLNAQAFLNAAGVGLNRPDAAAGAVHTQRADVNGAAQAQAPFIEPGGIVPIFSTVGVIQPGEWISIYGTNLAAEATSWNGDFPTSLGGTSVTINGKPAYLLFVSPNQINLQAPDDTATGPVPVVVTTAAGVAISTVTLDRVAPSFSLFGEHAVGIIIRNDGSGAYGGGSFDILGPTGNSLGFGTVAARAGDIVALYGVGFGPTNPAVPAGEVFTGAAPITDSMELYLNHVAVKPLFAGLSSAGLYQINLIVPECLGQGDVPIRALVDGKKTQDGVLFPLDSNSGGCSGSFAGGTGATGGTYPVPIVSGFVGGSSGGTMPGTGGGTWPPTTVGSSPPTTGGTSPPATGGSGGTGGAAILQGNPYYPRLRFEVSGDETPKWNG